ncbi:apolipoprotein N-acyltransferase [Sandaracinobacter sp. RS1-74]|uniref:apolipoprotein N-acyltransferase n=1 Tax=Sandaracinobacteroides sayramensis TaxID=2913411 RepID=UPI001EDC1A97|nr:apolipoprotein N-acyltransferase [Sandaracinobacteroides sayramensis]MCG2841899.1 apolipoprotein N-acyltransferase [Sandaracinobacteroides sayramensis]
MTGPADARHLIVQRLGRLAAGPALLLALLAGALSALGFEPVGSAAGPVAGSALLLLLLAGQPRGRAFLLGLGFGFTHFLLGLRWIAEAFTFQAAMPVWMGWVAVSGLSLFLALYPALAAWAARRLTDRIVPLALVFAGLFALAEILRGLLFSGFAWNPLGVGWLQLPGVAQLAAVVGANGLSALAVLAGGSLAALLGARGERGRMALVLVFPLLLALGLAVPRLQKPLPAAEGPDLLLVQTGTGIDDKYAEGGLAASLLAAAAQTRAALAEGPPPAAVVWPEATVEFPMEEMPEVRAEVTRGFPEGTLLLAGGVGLERDAKGEVIAGTNSLYALDHQGRILARYDKSHLVPGGEYLPLRAIAEPLGLARLVPGSLDFRPGPGALTWQLPGLPAVSPNICYEIIFPGAVVDRTARPAFLLTVSNDAWFGRSGPPQHHAQARLRAIEEGMPVVRVTPTGVTGLIDARGGMLTTLPKGEAASARVKLPSARAPTPFARIGLPAPAVFALLLVGAGLWIGRRKT